MGQSQSVPKLSSVSSCQSASSLDSSVSSSAKRSCKVDGLPISFPDDLTSCRNGEVKVKSVGIYMEPIQFKQSFGLPVQPFTHHFLIIDVDCVKMPMPDGGEEKPGFIKAEKGQDENCGQIKVECLNRFRALDFEEKRVCRLADCGTIRMQNMLEILQEPSSDYCFLTENCWKYADQTFRGLIKKISNLAEPGSETKERLESYLKGLPPLRMPGDAFNWSPVEALNCYVPPAVAAGTYLSSIAGVAACAAWAAGKPALALLPVLGLGSATPLAGPVALQVSLKFAAAAPFAGTVLAHHIPVATLFAAIKLGGGAAAGGHIAALSKTALVAAVAAVGSPHVLLTALAVVGGGFGGLVIAWCIYKLIRGVWTGFKDDMTLVEFVGYVFRGSWQCLCFGLKWVGKPIVSLFKWFFESIDSWFKGSGSPYGHIEPDEDTALLKLVPDGQTKSEGGIECFIGHTEFDGDTQPLTR